ncbi:MAG: TIM barrel protein [Patescibacteria group bacterium]
MLLENKKLKIKHLIGNLAIIPSPFYLISEVLRWEVPFLRKIESFKNGRYIGKANMALLKPGRYDGVELTMWGLFDENWQINQKRLISYQKSKIPFYTFHGCYEAFPRKFKNAYLNLAEKNPKIKKAIKSHIDAAAALKRDQKTILVFHPGKVINSNKNEGINNVLENITPLLDYAKKNNVIITLENMPYYLDRVEFFDNASNFEYVFKKINHPNLKIIFDWGHLNTQNLRHSKENKTHNYFENINNFINIVGKNIVHAHIHYNQSHFKNPNDNEVSPLKNFIIKKLLQTKIGNSFKKSAFIESLDQHLALNKIENQYLKDYTKTIQNLMEKSSILDYGFITHEIVPRRIFKFFTYQTNGADFNDYLKSLKIFKEMIN